MPSTDQYLVQDNSVVLETIDNKIDDHLSRWRRKHHWHMLIICSTVVALSWFFRLDENLSVEVPLGDGWRMPPVCMSRTLFGIDCPGCGLTRSFVALAEGDYIQSYTLHRLGWLMAIAVLIQFPYRIYELSRPKYPIPYIWRSCFCWTLFAALIFNWSLVLIGY